MSRTFQHLHHHHQYLRPVDLSITARETHPRTGGKQPIMQMQQLPSAAGPVAVLEADTCTVQDQNLCHSSRKRRGSAKRNAIWSKERLELIRGINRQVFWLVVAAVGRAPTVALWLWDRVNAAALLTGRYHGSSLMDRYLSH
jgi:hypothetical protein